MAKKVVGGLETKERLQKIWDEMLENGEYLSVSKVCKKAGIAPSTLYHCYGEWADRIKKRRDSKNGIKRRMIPSFSYKNNGEGIELIEKLRAEIAKMKKEINTISKENERLSRASRDSEKNSLENERLRAVIIKAYDVIKKSVDANKAQKMINEISTFYERHIKIVR